MSRNYRINLLLARYRYTTTRTRHYRILRLLDRRLVNRIYN
jgi:hypothetical protein